MGELIMKSLCFLAPLFGAICACTAVPSSPEKHHEPTLARELLELERQAFTVETQIDDPSLYVSAENQIDKLTSDTFKAFAAQKINVKKARSDEGEALKALLAIEQVLVENHFLLHIKTTLMRDMLSAEPPRPQTHLTRGREKFFNSHKDEMFYHFDCDLGSYLIMGIGDALELPITFVEVPNHNFVRWTFDDGTYINWDTNSAAIVTDDDFRRGRSRTSRQGFDQDTEIRAGYLRNMTRDEIKGYHLGLVGSRLSGKGKKEEARNVFEKAIELRPNGTTAHNNLSWMIVTSEKFQDSASAQRALTLSQKVYAIDPSDLNANDTLACAYAATGEFVRAIEIEKLAFSNEAKIAAFGANRTCLDMVLSGELEP
ncbi:tetratricopeptide repeat protein [Hyphomonas oceanitis]|uniref:Uncharacterized protein n=1 Tax=Hyphomonas oceanitis SCH89 TaxID=1280953 RepID=A0A059GCQ0_9PROT|nr:hypothetical protein [Hyphomonas oceanitis]KDA04350.1 hypothetical protein HOC_00655 [Hyphomonas oceanitis SCH89]